MGKKKKKKKKRIRVIALCVLWQDDHIFVTEYVDDPTMDQAYYRPLGGGVGFQEYGIDAVQRELMEEINAELTDVTYLTMLENIYKRNGKKAHQICLLYGARFAEEHRNQIDYTCTGYEGKNPFNALWMPLSVFRSGEAPLYPNGLLAFLDDVNSKA